LGKITAGPFYNAGEIDMEAVSLSDFTEHHDLSSMLLNDLLTQRKPQIHPQTVGGTKRIEELLEILRGSPSAGVAYGDPN
jgi:hypothetical protein